MVSKKYSRKRISKRRRNLKLRSRRMLGGGQPEPELNEFTIEFNYYDEMYNIIIKKDKTVLMWGSKSNYSLEVKKLNGESILEIKSTESGIDAFIRALFDKKQINQKLNPFINLKDCNSRFNKTNSNRSFSDIREEPMTNFIVEADKQLIREQIIDEIIKTETIPHFQELKEPIVKYKHEESENIKQFRWSIELSQEESTWINHAFTCCYGAPNKWEIIKEDFGWGKQSRYYIMPHLEISNFNKNTRDEFYENPKSDDNESTYDKSLDTIIAGKELEVKKINSKLSSLKLFVRNGKDDFCNQQYNGDYPENVADGLIGFFEKIMKTDPPKEFSGLKQRYDQLEDNKAKQLVKEAREKTEQRKEEAKKEAIRKAEQYHITQVYSRTGVKV